MSIISANDINARKFFRREDLSIFLDHMINYYGSTKPLFFTLIATNSEKRVAPVVGFCSCSVFCCALLCVHSGFSIILFGRE